MTIAHPFYDPSPELSVVPPQKDWPTMYDLPSEDPQEPGLPDEFHLLQPHLLSATLQLPDVPKDKIFTGADMNLYYDRGNSRWYKRPDWFLAPGVSRLYAEHDLRLSYVVWDEQVVPAVIVELISPGTLMSDLGEVKREPDGTPPKWQVYEQILKVPYYIVYDRYKERWWVFKLVGNQYQKQPVSQGRYWLSSLKVGIGLWQGEYDGITREWLRWYDADQNWIPTETERQTQRAAVASHEAETERQKAEAERQKAEAERQKAEAERQKAEKLAARLRELGIDPDDI